MTVDELLQRTREVYGKFPRKLSWEQLMIHLMEEMGELAQATLISSGSKVTNDPDKQRSKEDVADAICDVMYGLIVLADKFEVDIEKQYMKTMEHIEERIDAGEFERRDE